MAPEPPSLVQTPCAKTQEFCKAEFLDSTPVSALLCFFRQWNRRAASGFGSGLTVFDKKRLFRCQSPPGPPEPCCASFANGAGGLRPDLAWGLRFLIRNGFFDAKAGHSDQRFGIEILMLCINALCQNRKKLRFLRLFAGFFMEESCRGFFASNWLCSKSGRSLCERIKLILQLPQDVSTRYRSVDMTVFASGSSYFINSRVQKLKNSAKQNSWMVCRFPLLHLVTPVLSAAVCKNSRILQSRILG